MLWKTLMFLTVMTVALAGRIKRHETKYEFHIKHDYDYLKKHDHHHEKEQEQSEKEVEQQEEKKEDEQQEEEVQQEENKEGEAEQQNEGEDSNTESHKPENHEKSEYPAYEFGYKVHDPHKHDVKGHHEKRYGDEVKGAYWLVQPDGYKRTVKYEANKHDGYKVHVDYSKVEEHKDEEEHHPSKSEYYVTIHHGLKKTIPITEDVNEEQEQDKQEESAQHIPIYVI